MVQFTTPPWALSVSSVAEKLKTDDESGLTAVEAAERLQAEGPNRLKEVRGHGPFLLFLQQFADVMVGLLAVAAVVSGLVGEWTDTVLIAVIVFANAFIGFVQEWKADRALETLRRMSQPIARVRRDGQLLDVSTDELVPGDLVEVRAGDIVPADSRVVSATMFEVDEAPLTGESLPVGKSIGEVNSETPLPDRVCMVYAGTSAVQGHVRLLITATGARTEIGKIAGMLEHSAGQMTPLQRRLSRLNRWIVMAVVGISVTIFLAGILRESPSDWNRALFGQMLLVAVSLAVAAVPEGLPAIITITLALGSQRMSRKNAIVRQLSAVEGLGSVDVICSDKTGTLTQNRMSVATLIPDESEKQGKTRLLEAAALCNNAETDSSGSLVGSATEVALLSAAMNEGLDIALLRNRFPRTEEIPFSSEQKWMATLHRRLDGLGTLCVKGAAEKVLERCEFSESSNAEEWNRRSDELAHTGARVLALACRTADDHDDSTALSRVESLRLLGLIGIEDPVRPEVEESIRRCRSAGIRPVMITGDHPQTALAVARKIGLMAAGDELITGAELEMLTDEELASRMERIACFARVSPEHKLRIVSALQSRGHTVAMTGDGVNDAPALKRADIGVAMGITGTDVSREASDLILADDNFSTIVAAVEEGRVVYDNIRKFVAYLLTANLSEVLVLLGAILLGLPLPVLPVHLLWINLVTDGPPALALGFEPPESDIMRRRPRSRDAGLFADRLGRVIIALGGMIAAVCLGLFYFELSREANGISLTKARSMVFFVLASAQLFYVCGIRSFSYSLLQLGLWSNYRLAVAVLLGLILQLCTLYVPALRGFFHTEALMWDELLLCLVVSLLPLAALEIWKRVSRLSQKSAF
jgi:Ca2+-transporting ATPase